MVLLCRDGRVKETLAQLTIADLEVIEEVRGRLAEWRIHRGVMQGFKPLKVLGMCTLVKALQESWGIPLPTLSAAVM
jgi:hypothetical protein